MEDISKGQWIFALTFIIAFAAAISWSYFRDKPSVSPHYKGVYRILIFIVLVLSAVYLFVRLKN